jgi:predicted transcriptional regulator
VARFLPTHVGKLQRKALALSNADEAVSLNRKGWSGEAIAAHLRVSTKTVQNYLRRFLAQNSRFGIEITPEVVAELRAEAREHIQGNQRRILARLERLQAAVPESVEEECRLADSIFKGSDAFIRAHAALASMYGLNAPEGNGSGSVTTNNTVNISEVDLVRHIANVRGIKLVEANGG